MTKIDDFEDLVVVLCYKCRKKVIEGKIESIRDMIEFKILMKTIEKELGE